MKSQIVRRARLRSRATGEAYATALTAILGTRPTSPVVPVPSREQSMLEGHVFASLRVLHHSGPAYPDDLPGPMEFVPFESVTPANNSLIVHVSSTHAADALADHLFPELEPGFDELPSYHAAGLRLSAHRLGTQVTIPGRAGTVVFAGVSAVDVATAHRRRYHEDETPCLAAAAPSALTAAEVSALDKLRLNELHMTSSIVRRLGLLRHLRAESIDTWHRLVGGMSVEVWRIAELDAHDHKRLISDLTSPWLHPRWIEVDGGEPTPNGTRHAFVLEDGTCTLDLRLVMRN